MAIERRFILANTKEEAKNLFNGGTITDEDGNEVTAGKNSIVFVPENTDSD